jgi:hypothetical protein
LKGNSPSRPIVIYGIVALALISMIYLVTEQVFSSSAIQGEKIKGVSLVAPPQPFQQDPFAAIQKINANAVAIMPYAFSVPGNGEVIYNHPRQWWGERKEGTIETIVKAKEAGMKISRFLQEKGVSDPFPFFPHFCLLKAPSDRPADGYVYRWGMPVCRTPAT